MNDHFNKIFWYIVYLTSFGMGFTVWLLLRFSGDSAERFADQAMIFWLTSAVGGGIGYLIGSSMNRNKPSPPEGSSTDTTTETKITEVIKNPPKEETTDVQEVKIVEQSKPVEVKNIETDANNLVAENKDK